MGLLVWLAFFSGLVFGLPAFVLALVALLVLRTEAPGTVFWLIVVELAVVTSWAYLTIRRANTGLEGLVFIPAYWGVPVGNLIAVPVFRRVRNAFGF